MKRGCSQESGVLSVLLWVDLVDGLLIILSLYEIKLQVYVDDLVRVVKLKSKS